eukprot:376053-Lingulodinium_polyedra.AAC.1
MDAHLQRPRLLGASATPQGATGRNARDKAIGAERAGYRPTRPGTATSQNGHGAGKRQTASK